MRFITALLATTVLFFVADRANAAVSSEWAARWRADLAFVADTLPKVHPNLFHAVSRAEFTADLDSLSRRLNGLEQDEIVVELARIVARIPATRTRYARYRGVADGRDGTVAAFAERVLSEIDFTNERVALSLALSDSFGEWRGTLSVPDLGLENATPVNFHLSKWREAAFPCPSAGRLLPQGRRASCGRLVCLWRFPWADSAGVWLPKLNA